MIEINNFSVDLGGTSILKNITAKFNRNEITAIIGPSGCGKSTLLRSINRLIDEDFDSKISGEIKIDGINIFDKRVNLQTLRKMCGMVFQKPIVFDSSIFQNVALALKYHGIKRKSELDLLVKSALAQANLLDEVRFRLKSSAHILSGGQQQRLCIARSIAIKPEILLLDEPTSALDVTSTAKIEQLLKNLKKDFTIVLVTHNVEQAKRLASTRIEMKNGKVAKIS